MNKNINILNNMLDKIEKLINMPISQKTSKFAKTCKMKLHIFDRGTLKYSSMTTNIKYNLVRLICKCMNLRGLIIIML